MSRPEYLVGIDLGTTNCVVAYSPISDEPTPAALFPIPQLIGPGQVVERPTLPSFRFHPHSQQFSDADLTLPWQHQSVADDIDCVVIGEWARELGSQAPAQMVSSAKSWLSHDKVDRIADILPWIAGDEVNKVSPLIASASYLNYIRQAWDHKHPIHKLADQTVTITIPASFDEVARKLTVEAAALAGLSKVTLVEEPQASCYDWVERRESDAQQLLTDHQHVLVVDVGGGTTDLSLIATHNAQQQFELARVAVGEHLMLGGDNVDLAIAHFAEQKLSSGSRMNAANLTKLTQQARRSKETLLAKGAPEQSKITLLGSGSKLIAASRSVEVEKQQIHSIALDGFFPLTDVNDLPQSKRSAIVEFGLPFVSDAAVSKHIAQFLAEHNDGVTPTAVLFNGGLFNSPIVVERVTQLLSNWAGESVTVLENPHPDHSVALGAVAFMQARRGKLTQIKSGASRSFFLHLPSKTGPGRALCLLKKGEPSGTEIRLSGRTFSLTLNQPAKFNILTSHQDIRVKGELIANGQIIDVVDKPLSPLPPLITTIEHQDNSEHSSIDVQLVAEQTEIGTINLQCVSVDSDTRWTLEFDTRSSAAAHSQEVDPALKSANQLVSGAFSGNRKTSANSEVKTLYRQLEKQLGNKEQWSFDALRSLFDTLLQGRKRRRRSERHEQIWLRLAGHTLRPGFGDSNDSWRINQLWAINQHQLQFDTTQSWNDWWTMWRRIAGGLSQQQQETLLTQIAPFLHPGAVNSKQAKEKAHQHGYEAMVKLAASLEKLEIEDKTLLGNWFIKRAIEHKDHNATHWWAIARLGSRFSLQQNSQNLLPKSVVEEWLNQALVQDWKAENSIGFCAAMLARKVEDRQLNVDAALQQQVADKLAQTRSPKAWFDMVNTLQPLDEAEQSRAMGDTLPHGLRLKVD